MPVTQDKRGHTVFYASEISCYLTLITTTEIYDRSMGLKESTFN